MIVSGLPDKVRACLFDLDGVLTQTAKVHGAAWKEMFDAYLRARAERESRPFVPFDAVADLTSMWTASPDMMGRVRFWLPEVESFPKVILVTHPTPKPSVAWETERTRWC